MLQRVLRKVIRIDGTLHNDVQCVRVRFFGGHDECKTFADFAIAIRIEDTQLRPEFGEIADRQEIGNDRIDHGVRPLYAPGRSAR